MIRYIFLFSAVLFLWCRGFAFDFSNPAVHCGEDTIKAEKIVEELQSSRETKGKRLVETACALKGGGIDTYYHTDSVGSLRLNLDDFTPLMFVNTVVAIENASEKPGVASWKNVVTELENIACRRGENNGFPSIMFHGADWVADNVFRGNIKELTENYPGALAVRTKSLDDMTRNRDKYAALSDPDNFEKVRMTEMGFRTHRIPTLKKESIEKKELLSDLKDGDIILFVPGGDGYDIYDMGFISIREDGPHLIHLSPRSKTVVEEEEPLQRYMKLMTKYFQGYRLLRVL